MRATSSFAIVMCGVLATGGCYLSHGTDRASGGRDAGVRGDGSVLADGAALDARDDAPRDAGRDGGPDAEPIEEPPPDPAVCRTEPEIHPFDAPILEYRWPNGSVTHTDFVHVCSTPVVIDLEPTGGELTPEIVFVSYSVLGREEPGGMLRIVDPRTDTTISYPPHDGELGVLEASGNLAAGDLDGDGRNEIVGIGVSSGTFAFRSDGTLLWESPYPTAMDRGLRPEFSIGGGPSIADLEGDGVVEVVVGRNVIDGATGAHRWTGAEGTARGINSFLGPLGCVADLDEDGVQEVIAGHTAFRANGEIYWNNPDAYDGICAVADVRTDVPGPEVVLVSRGQLRYLNGRTGEQLWMQRLEGRLRLALGGAPTVSDFDGDGALEVGVAHGGAYGVYDPTCRAGMPGCLGDGVLWSQPSADDSSSGTGSSVFDFNGDGRSEVIYNDQYHFRVYDGTSGDVVFQHANSSRTRTENPTIADVDGDGDAEIVFSANAEAFFIREYWTDPGVEIWGDARGRWVGARRIWNQHAYHITNVEEDGTIPRPEQPSWRVHNAYRQNLREGGDVLAVPDLWGGHGSFECTGRNRAMLTVNVQNWGLERVGAGVVVAFYRGHPDAGGVRIGEVRTTTPLEPRGGSETVRFDATLDGSGESWWAMLDYPEDLGPTGSVAECLETNNHVIIWRPRCD